MKDFEVLESRSHDMKADRQALGIQAAGQRGCRLLRQVEGVAEGCPVHPFTIMTTWWNVMPRLERGNGHGGRYQQVIALMEPLHLRDELLPGAASGEVVAQWNRGTSPGNSQKVRIQQ